MAITKDHWSPCPAMPWASPGARRTVVCSTPRKPRASIPALESISPFASPSGPASPDSRCTCTVQDHTHLWLCSDPANFPHAWVSAEPLTASTHRLGEMARYHCTCENVSPLCDCGGKRLLMDRRAQVEEVTESLVPSVRANARPRGWATLQQDGRRLLLGPTRDAQWAPRGRRRVAPGDLAFGRLQVLLVLPKFAWKTASSSRRGPVSLTTGCGGCGNRAPGPALPGGTTAPLSCSAGSVSASLTAVPPARTPPCRGWRSLPAFL